MLQKNEIIGGLYQIVREINTGGTGVIYLGYHLRLQKYIVIKKIKDGFTEKMNVRAEADILKRLHHTYLPSVYDFLVLGNQVYTVMDFIEGKDLKYYLDQGAVFPEKVLLKWLKQLTEVLDYLHSQKPPILHSDIKPGNIMIKPSGDVCLIDFNISLDGAITKEIQGLSQYYAAPEQYACALGKMRGEPPFKHQLDGRMDIYSLGAVFYRIMSGQYPNPEYGAPQSLLNMDISYSDGLKGIISKAMELDPKKRFQSAEKMGKALENMEKQDPRYRVLIRLQYAVGFLCGLAMMAGVLLLYAGGNIRQQEQWQKSYKSFADIVENGEEENIQSEGTDILNNFLLRGYFRKNPEDKAVVLATVGDSYFRQEEYEEAAEYYKEAVEGDEDNTQYFRDYLASLVRSGESFSTEELISTYPKASLGGAETALIEAEMSWAEGKSEEALQKTEKALLISGDAELNARICQLRGEIFWAEGEYMIAVEEMEEAVRWKPDKSCRRMAGQMFFEAGNVVQAETTKSTCYEKALDIYEALCQEANPSYEDLMNRALVQRALGKYKNSIDSLMSMKTVYPDDYRVLMWICYNYLDLAKEKGTYEEVENTRFYYNACLHEYNKNGRTDEDMEALIEIMDEMG